MRWLDRPNGPKSWNEKQDFFRPETSIASHEDLMVYIGRQQLW